MKQLFTLSKKDLELSKQEVLRLYDISKFELVDNLLIIDSDKDYASRLAYTSEAYEFLFECKEKELEKTVEAFDWKKIYEKSYSARIIGNEKISERKIGGIIYDRLDKPKVDLRNAKTKIVFFSKNKKIICAKLKIAIEKTFMERRAHLRPQLHPTSLHPQLARACINLTGKVSGRFLDPFCGSGGILIEAGLIGFDVTGYDIDRIMVNRSKINLDHYKIKNYDIKLSDATKIKENFDCIVTDLPYGKNSKVSDELEMLYSNFLKSAYDNTDVAVVLFPDFKDYTKLVGKWNVVMTFDYYLHKSLSKKIVVLEK